MVGRGGALPRCCAPPHEQIFDIPALSRGGGARSVKFPPPSGLIGLCFRGWGQASKTVQFRDLQLSPNTRSKGEPWSPEDAGRIVYFQFSPRRRAWRVTSDSGASVSLSIKWGRNAGSVGKVSEAPSTPRSFTLSIVRSFGCSALLFRKREVPLPLQFRLGLGNPKSGNLRRAGVLSSRRILI